MCGKNTTTIKKKFFAYITIIFYSTIICPCTITCDIFATKTVVIMQQFYTQGSHVAYFLVILYTRHFKKSQHLHKN